MCYAKPHGPASKDTVARWMKTKEAGIEDFAPHSFRGAAASAMLSSGMTSEDVMKKAGWSKGNNIQDVLPQTSPEWKDEKCWER